MSIYILIFERDFTKSYTGFHKDLTEYQGIIRWWHYIKSAYLISTNLTTKQLSHVVTVLLQKYSLGARYLVIEVNLSNRQGMLPKEA